MKRHSLAFLIGAWVWAAPAFAQSDSMISISSFGEPTEEAGWKPFFGLSTGYMTQGGQYETEGNPTSFKFIGSYATDDWLIDVGGGLQHQFMANGRSSTLPLLEGSVRYRLAHGWQIGPIWNTYLADSTRYGSANLNFTSFIGINAAKDLTWEGHPFRVGGTFLTDVDIRNEQVGVFLLNVQMGFDPSPRQSEVVVIEEEVRPANHLIRQAQVLTPQKPLARFSLQSAELSAPDRTYLRRVASLLKLNADQYKVVTIVGHTDSTGPEAFNDKLSLNRAQNVKAYLVSHGVPERQLLVTGRAAKDPISSDLDPNRRVEIRFTAGVPSHLENALLSLE